MPTLSLPAAGTILRALAVSAALVLPHFGAAAGALADLRIHDRATGQDLPIHWHEGRAYVVGRPGNEYQLKIRNRAGEDLLAVIAVDGVNVLSGDTARPDQGGYVLSPGGPHEIRGWRKSLAQTAAFYFTSLGDSYAARTGRPDHVGVIGVALFRRQYEAPLPAFVPAPAAQPESPWPGKQAAAPQESRDSPAGGLADANTARKERTARADAPLGTGHGRRENTPTRMVEFKRATPQPAETLVIHYDSYRNLIARGILVSPRDPQPFPGFVPDPVGRSGFSSHEPGA